ncbi:MAG TPA: aldo/keto reductase [Vicinamibacterales bacterium]|nr:aldo/keto reductase [Vicinamibacterales bacterium]
MITRRLGKTDFEITTIGLGTWAIGGRQWGPQDDQASIAAIHAAIDHGINWVDTAPMYGGGHSEEVVGRALKALPVSRRPLVFTKFGLGVNVDAPVKSASAREVVEECDASLRRLGVDHIDLFQLHWPVPQPIAETARACATLLAAGKIRAIGVSNYSVAQLEEWMATGVPLHSDQPPYSILRPAAGVDVLPWCAAHDVGAISYSPLFRGLLFGTWSRNKTFGPDDARGAHKDYSGPRFQRHLDAVDELQAIARTGGLSCAQLCVGVLLATPGLTGVICGARDARQGALVANLGVTVTADQSRQVWAVADRLRADLETL